MSLVSRQGFSVALTVDQACLKLRSTCLCLLSTGIELPPLDSGWIVVMSYTVKYLNSNGVLPDICVCTLVLLALRLRLKPGRYLGPRERA